MQLTNPTEIKALLNRHGFRFSKAMGQNFLTAAWVPERIAQEAAPDDGTGVLEVGPGIGCLTAELSRHAGKVVAVELDERLRPILAETLSGCANVELVFGNVLKLDLPALVRERLAGLRPVVCANLPYNVTSPLLAAFLEAGCFEEITVMVQREVAHRLCAKAGTAEYGAFTIDGRQCGYADIYVTSPDTQTNSSILWNTFFGDIKTSHDLNSGDKQCRQFFVWL